ncbi:MAG TPA: UDP-galactopyranose mutase [Patescibacteria group bacterium]|nr:UDP-galactopyranose mutase [Patescibacteria group bacterium]
MKIGILGAGLTGCSLARLLVDRGHKVSLFEKNKRIGGLCISDRNEWGLLYEPCGPRIFHTCDEEVKAFVEKFSAFNGYRHYKGVIIKGRLLPFPITLRAITLLPDAAKIMKELKARPRKINQSNFETACICVFGKTLYKYFISNYTRKMWGVPPDELSAHWAPKRLMLRECNNEELFKGEWQGLPIEGYSVWLERMSRGISLQKNVNRLDAKEFDLIVSTAPIDEISGYRYGRLNYRSSKFMYAPGETWEEERYGGINLPQHPRFIRKTNFRILHRQVQAPDLIQYQQPCAVRNGEVPMYPVHTGGNEALFQKYLSYVVSLPNVCPAGRLGLFEYLDMDEAVACAMKLVPFIEKYHDVSPRQRASELNRIRRHLL